MKRIRFTEEQIIAVLREHDAGAKTADLARKHGVSEARGMDGRQPSWRSSGSAGAEDRRRYLYDAGTAAVRKGGICRECNSDARR
jgi:putative transposase